MHRFVLRSKGHKETGHKGTGHKGTGHTAAAGHATTGHTGEVCGKQATDALLPQMRRFQDLQELEWPELLALAETACVVEVAAGRCVIRPGRTLRGRWFLLRGVLVDPVSGKRLRSDRKRGQAQLYPGNTHLIALTKVTLLQVDGETVNSVDALIAGPSKNGAESILSTDPWLERLAASPLLQALYRRLGSEGWQHWFAGLESMAMPQGRRVFEVGDASQYFYLVQSGQARIELGSPAREFGGTVSMRGSDGGIDWGARSPLQVGAGGFFGEDGLLTEQPRNATVVMSGAGVLLRGERVHLDYLLDALWWTLRRQHVAALSDPRPAQSAGFSSAFPSTFLPTSPSTSLSTSLSKMESAKNDRASTTQGTRAAAGGSAQAARVVDLPNYQSSLALRDWLDQLPGVAAPRPIVRLPATLSGSVAGIPALALLLLAHRGARLVLPQESCAD